MNDLATSCAAIDLGMDPKSLYRQGISFQPSTQISAGRQQQAGKEDYLVALFHNQLTPEKIARQAIIKFIERSLVPWEIVVDVVYYSSWCEQRFFRRTETQQADSSSLEILEPILQLEKLGQLDAALDVLYERVYGLLKNKRFAEVDELLRHVIVGDLSVDVLLGLLTATLPAKSKLSVRSKFYYEAEASIKERGEWENGLLTGLEP